MTARRSSGSRRAESSVEPTRSQNMTVSWRRSASLDTVVVARSGKTSGAGRPPSIAAMASSSRRRCPIEATPSSRRSSAVSRRNTSPSISLSRNAGTYCSSPRPRSHSATSIEVVRKRERRSKYYSPHAWFCPDWPLWVSKDLVSAARDAELPKQLELDPIELHRRSRERETRGKRRTAVLAPAFAEVTESVPICSSLRVGNQPPRKIAASRQLVEQRFGVFEIARAEALGEPAVDRREKVARFDAPSPVSP